MVAVALGNYRRVLALPGVGTLLALMFAARIPMSATSMVLTLHVVLTLHRSYGAAGLVGAAGTIGIAIGAPLTGRLGDGWGLRGMVGVPVMSVGRQALAALVSEEHRKAAFSLDSISVEMSFMVGPAVAVLVA